MDSGNNTITLSNLATGNGTVGFTANPDQISTTGIQISFDATKLSVSSGDVTLPTGFMADNFDFTRTLGQQFNGGRLYGRHAQYRHQFEELKSR